MWDRVELKTQAKKVLKDNYWKAFLISLVILIAGGDSGGGGSVGTSASDVLDSAGISFSTSALLAVSIVTAAIIILIIAFRVLIGYGLEVGSRKYFVQTGQYKDSKGCYNFAFDSFNFKGIISTMFLKALYTFLWSLLFLIPGIIKSYSYRMVPYILADNPNLGADEAITLSRQMMDGNKFSLFVLELSFLGWYLLGALALGIGILFVNPYYNATEAQLYLFLRDRAIGLGYCTNEDLNLRNDWHHGYYWN